MSKIASFFLPIVKVDKTPEGHRLVTGTVSTERLDLDGQIADYGWAKKEAQAWFDIANVREQHSRNAVGKGLDLQLDDPNKTISLTAKVVDPVAIAKLDEKIYTGFSFGAKSVPGNPIKVIKDAQAPNGRIVGGSWVEISLADRPANPDSVLTVAKAADSAIEVGEELGEFSETDTDKVAEPDEEKTSESVAETEKALTGDEAIHNAPLEAARAAIRQLIAQEAGEAESGNTYQLRYLIDALQALDGFISSEADEAYSTMVVEMAALTDKAMRRGLYKSVSEALKKAAEDHKAKIAIPDEPKVAEPDGEKLSGRPVISELVEPVKPAVVVPETKFVTEDEVKSVIVPDKLKAMLPELLKEHTQVLKEVLSDAFAAKELEKTVETLGKRAQPGGPVINPEAAGLRAIEKSHPVNSVVDPSDVPIEVLAEMNKYAEMTKSDDVAVSQSARRVLAKLKTKHGIAE